MLRHDLQYVALGVVLCALDLSMFTDCYPTVTHYMEAVRAVKDTVEVGQIKYWREDISSPCLKVLVLILFTLNVDNDTKVG